MLYIVKFVFNFYLNDPSNDNLDFKRTRIRNLLNNLKNEGLDEKKLKLTINNLTQSSIAIDYYVKKNIKLNSNFTKVDNKFKCIINKEFFENPKEVVFRSMGEILQKISGNYYAARGKSMMNLLRRIKSKKNLIDIF